MAEPHDESDLWQAWAEALRSLNLEARIEALYAEVDQAITARGPTCWQSGKCCRFDAYGHLMYVTGLEITWVLRKLSEQTQGPNGGEAMSPVGEIRHTHTLPQLRIEPGCVFQRDGLCSIHTVRPLGCRIFFCQQGTQDWQQDLYERFLAELRAMHEAHGLPYRYMEWRQGLVDAQHALRLAAFD